MTAPLSRRALLALSVAAAAALPLGAARAQDAAAPATPAAPVVEEMVMGSADAPVTVIEYASLTCPHCARFQTDVFGKLRADYIDTGKVRFIVREVYFDRFGLWAGMVARCGGAMKYFGMIDLIYKNQAEWLAGGTDAPAIAANLRKLGRTGGMTDAALEACLNDAAMAEALVAEFQKTTKADQIDSTPSFIIDGEKYSNMSYEEFSKILDEKLAAK